MNGNRNHTLYGVLFILACLIVAGGLYAVIRSPTSRPDQPGQIMDNTQLNIEEGDESGTTVDSAIVNEPAVEASVDAAPADDTPGGAQLGMCRMDDCSWSKETGRKVVKSDRRGTLVKLSLISGSSKGENDAITWDANPHDVFVFCSTALPSVILGEAVSWQVDVLDFVDGVPGVLESSQALYMKTCHAADRQFPNDAETLGYTSIPEGREDVKISRADDIFDHVAP